jgi:hypothetical protein
MKNLLMVLVLANVLYFMWDRFVEKPSPVGVAMVDENRLGPPLMIANNANATTNNGAMPGAGGRTELAAAVGRSCVSISFRENAEAGSTVNEYIDEGMQVSVRSAPGEIFIGNWVQIDKIPTREQANELLETLQAGGISDVFLMNSEGSFKISLGLFGEKSGVERRELEARSLGVEVDVVPEVQDAILYYVDIALLPGRGAGAMIERFGEERVLLRERATCPTAD